MIFCISYLQEAVKEAHVRNGGLLLNIFVNI